MIVALAEVRLVFCLRRVRAITVAGYFRLYEMPWHCSAVLKKPETDQTRAANRQQSLLTNFAAGEQFSWSLPARGFGQLTDCLLRDQEWKVFLCHPDGLHLFMRIPTLPRNVNTLFLSGDPDTHSSIVPGILHAASRQVKSGASPRLSLNG